MPTATLACPHCSATLTTTKAFRVGSRFRCPSCGADFAVEEDDAPTLVSGSRTSVPSVRPLPPAADDAPRRSHGWLVLLGVVGASLLLLAGAGAALALHFLLPKREAPPVAAASSTPAAPTDPVADEQPQPPPDDSTDLPQPKKPKKPRPQPLNAPPDLAPPQPAPGEPSVQSVLPAEEQKKVNAAIDHGVEYLKNAQKRNGAWGEKQHSVGLAALPGLTLLECGVATNDRHVQLAAEFVRKKVPELTATYELALAILFLDRLGDAQDEPLIRTMALRLLAGESPAGGWTYQCPLVSEKDEQKLWTILEATRPRSSLDLMTTKSGDKGIDDLFTGASGDRPADTGATIPLSPGPTEAEKKQVRKMYDGLSSELQDIPALKPPTKEDQMPKSDLSDNSNTQFATLGLWAAGRHGVPMERALALLAKRFQVSQYATGGWSYRYPHAPAETPTMTGAGLLGLAVGHGVTADLKGADVEKAGEDPRVEKGMKALGQYVGKAAGHAKVRSRPLEKNYYFLWSVERVGMLYGRKTIGDNEWYPWGAEDLVEMQEEEDGSWDGGSYFGATSVTDSCFALLFLKRANLAKDLSTKLQFLTEIKKP